MVQASRYYIADARDVGVAKFMLEPEPKLINNEIEKEGRKEEKKKKEEKKMRSGSFSCQLLDSRC